MADIIKPATPLPWHCDNCLIRNTEKTVFGSELFITDDNSDAKYIVQAANAYPRLMEENKKLREALQEISLGTGWHRASDMKEIACAALQSEEDNG